jgi:alanyl-tRNA synthetase
LTERLYQDDSYLTTFTSCVRRLRPHEGGHAVILDATLFYPESGGQPHDTGRIDDLTIDSVIEDGEDILHISSGEPAFGEGATVKGTIDWPRRFLNMQQHTGQHILSAAFIEELDAKTVSSKLAVDHCTVDVARLDLSWDEIQKIERLSNSIVYENRPVKVYQARSGEVEGLRMKKAIDREIVRIVEVEGFDRSPCGGTHCRMTGEIGLIKILRREKVRDTTRVEFICGILAEADYFWKSRFVVELAQDLTTRDSNVPKQIHDMLAGRKDLRREVQDLKRRLVKHEAARLTSGARSVGDIKIVSVYLKAREAWELREIAQELTGRGPFVALLACGLDRVQFVFACSREVAVDMRKPMQAACGVVGGRGGGKPEMCQGGGKRVERAQEALDTAWETIERLLSERA